MKRKLLGSILTMTMVMTLLAGCGDGANESNENAGGGNNTVVSQVPESSVKENEADNNGNENTLDNNGQEQNDEVTSDTPNPYAETTFSLCWDGKLKQSAVVSFDPEKVALTNLSYNAAELVWLDKKSVTLLLMCENNNSSVEELYQKEMGNHMEKDHFTVSALTEKQIGNYTVFRSDAVWNSSGEAGFEFFALKLDNGMILYSVHIPDFEKPVHLDEILPHVLANVTEGDGTKIEAALWEAPEDAGKPDGIEWDTFMEVTSLNGVKVKVYYDPDVITGYHTFDMEFYPIDANGNEFIFAIGDFETAQARLENRKAYLSSQEKYYKDIYFSEISEGGAGGYKVWFYQADYLALSYSGDEWLPTSSSECVIELGSGVVCIFDGNYWFDETLEIGKLLNAMKFVIE